MEIYFLMLLFAMVPLTYAGCPGGMCCPVGDNCDVSNRFCKPDSSRDCREGKYILQFIIMLENSSAGHYTELFACLRTYIAL